MDMYPAWFIVPRYSVKEVIDILDSLADEFSEHPVEIWLTDAVEDKIQELKAKIIQGPYEINLC